METLSFVRKASLYGLITDAEGNETAYGYDGFDRRTSMTYDDSSGSTYEYDKNSNLTKHITPGGNDIDYTYDALNRRLTKEFESDSDLDITYGYDVGSRMTSADTTASQIDYVYDDLNRVTSTTQTLNAIPYTLGFEYDDAGNRTEVAYPGGKVVNYVYDELNRMTDINVNSSGLVDYTYDTLDRRTEKSFISTNLPLTAYNYDIANQLTDITNSLLPSSFSSQYAYTYDEVGNREEMVVTGTLITTGTFTYAYNDIYELTGVSGADSHSYAYDNVGNRTTVDSVSYTANTLNQYTQVASTNFSYDGNDNLADDGTNDYTYDESNRLLTFSDGTDSASYEYDAFNRRISKTVNSVTTYYIYDGNEVIEEYNSSDVLQADYVMGSRIDEPLTMTRSSTTYYYHLDGLGSIKQITNSSGVVQESYDYDPYGNTTIYNSSGTPVSASVIGNRFMFTGREYDEESGIYHYRARQYDPSIGRFLQRDPMGYYDSMNLFEYVYSNPINYIDPTGFLGFKDFWTKQGTTKFKAIGSDLASRIANHAAKKLPRGRLRGVVKMVAGGFATSSGLFATAVSAASIGTMIYDPTKMSLGLAGLAAGAAIAAYAEIQQAAEYFEEGLDEILNPEEEEEEIPEGEICEEPQQQP